MTSYILGHAVFRIVSSPLQKAECSSRSKSQIALNKEVCFKGCGCGHDEWTEDWGQEDVSGGNGYRAGVWKGSIVQLRVFGSCTPTMGFENWANAAGMCLLMIMLSNYVISIVLSAWVIGAMLVLQITLCF